MIRAFNENKPFDQFTVEQLAGDLLENPTDDQLVATAFHRNTQTNNEGGTNDEEYRNVAIVDRVNTTMATWMGTTMACAQCHTHKYDPITQEEYFKMFAILNQSQDADRRDESPTVPVLTPSEQLQEQLRDRDRASRSWRHRWPLRRGATRGSCRWENGLKSRWEPMVTGEITGRPSPGRRWSQLDDGSLLVSGEAAETDTYTVAAPRPGPGRSPRIRLEVLDEASLGPVAGPGRGISCSTNSNWWPARSRGRNWEVCEDRSPGNAVK